MRVSSRWPRACARVCLVMTLMLVFLPWLDLAAAASPFVVNSTLDQPDAAVGNGVCAAASGFCTLRAAVQEGQASNRAVSVPAGLFELTLGQLAVTQNLTLTGAGSGKTKIDGTINSRVFDIATTGFAYIGSVTLQWGKATAGFLGHMHGGAIHNHGTLVLVASTIRASSTPAGWGGGGITNAGGTATLQNVTIASNFAAANGGGIENSGTLNAYNVTIINNDATSGGGIYNTGTAGLKNTIVANNFSGGNCGGTTAITDNGFNLDSGATCGFPVGRSNRNPMLGARDADDTYPLLPGSPAIDFGTNIECPSSDQRGAARPQDGNSNGVATCDVGAYEVVPPDLKISFMSDSPDPVQAGGDLIYTVDVLNPGPTPLANVRLVDSLPAGVAYNNYAETRGGTCSQTTAHTITCDLASLDGNRVWTIYLYTSVDSSTVGSISNQATATATGVDPDSSNNTASELTTVVAAPEPVLDHLVYVAGIMR